MSSALHWKSHDGFYRAVLDSETLVVLRGDGNQFPSQTTVEIAQIQGTVLYSKDQTIIGSPRFPRTIRSATPTEVSQDQKMRDALNELTWRPVKAGDHLESWQMIWTGKSGRVEIEILRTGSEYLFDEATDVRRADGKFTRKKRFREETFFVLHPNFYRSAKVNKVIGHAFVSTSRDQVEEFLRQYGEIMHSWKRENAATAAKWRELLRRPDLE